MKYIHILFILMLCLVVLSSACQTGPGESNISVEDLATPSLTPTSPTSPQTSTPEEQTGKANPLPPDPLDVVFFSEDEIELKGRFFPSTVLEQPVIVLMHWYQGDQREWEEIAYWLQNRGVSANREGAPWLDSSWFPVLPQGTSYNVLTFTFRNCEGGCSQPTPEDWLRDARASLEAARSLQGVDPDRVIAIGASIGGDAAISSCLAALEKEPNACLGSLSISPGSYLGESYPELVNQLGKTSPPRPVWCLYDESDPDAGNCQAANGPHYHAVGWQGSNLHGMHLITSTLDPLPLSSMLDFLNRVIDN